MLHLRTLSVTALVALLTACTATTPSKPEPPAAAASAADEVIAEREPTPAPQVSEGEEEAAAPAEQRNIYYSPHEFERMSACVSRSDTAMHTAIRRNGGMSEDDAMSIYRGRPFAEENMAVVQQVYADTVGNVWDYAVRTFQHCAITEAAVPQARLKLASYCLQRQMIGDLSYSFKANGRPKEDAYRYFAKFRSPIVRQVIDAVYGADASKEDVKAQLWSGCMAPITG